MDVTWHVVIPCFNHGRFLPDCIRSVARALVQGTAVTVVDDASTDDTPAVVSELQVQYPWLQAIRLAKNGGSSVARNVAIAATPSQYVLPLDADDRLSRRYLECCERTLQTADVACTARRRFGAASDRYPAAIVTLEKLKRGPFIHCACPYRRECWEKIGGYDEAPDLRMGWEDYEFWIRMAKAAVRFGVADRRAFLWHRRHLRNEVEAEADSRQVSLETAYRQIRANIRRRHPGFACDHYFPR